MAFGLLVLILFINTFVTSLLALTVGSVKIGLVLTGIFCAPIIEEIVKYIEKYPDKEVEFNKLMIWGLYGMKDLSNTIHAVVSYGSKGL